MTSRLHNNSISTVDPHLAWLTDRWAVPEWIPWGNVFSVGDVLIAIGVVATIVLAMHGRSRPVPERTERNNRPLLRYGIENTSNLS